MLEAIFNVNHVSHPQERGQRKQRWERWTKKVIWTRIQNKWKRARYEEEGYTNTFSEDLSQKTLLLPKCLLTSSCMKKKLIPGCHPCLSNESTESYCQFLQSFIPFISFVKGDIHLVRTQNFQEN